jgi:hypothetical protein
MRDKINIFSHKRSASAPIGSSSSRLPATRDESDNRDREHRENEAEERRQRDRVLRDIGGRRSQGAGNGNGDASDSGSRPTSLRSGRRASNAGKGFDDERDLDGEGYFVNYAVDFSFDGRHDKDAWSLHFLCYMGLGLKGIGGAELRE